MKYARLFNLVYHKQVTVAVVFSKGLTSIKFRRTLLGDNLVLWRDLVSDCSEVRLRSDNDKLVWLWSKSGVFSVKSFYLALRNQHFLFPFHFIWGLKLPLRIKIFIWLVLKKRILTKDNLYNRGWSGDINCVFCGLNENINHLFLGCPLARFIWNVVGCAFGLTCTPVDIHQLMTNWIGGFAKRTRKLILIGIAAVIWSIWKFRNAACFKHQWPSEPVHVIFDICRFIELWAKMQKEVDQDLLVQGAKMLNQVVMEVFGARRRWSPWIKKLTF